MIGLFGENGPYRAVPKGEIDANIIENPNSWHKVANVLYIDNPLRLFLN
jgi:carboxypeptidase C (cathepsin A)